MNFTLAERIALWAYLTAQAEQIEADIRSEVLALEQTIDTPNARATYGSGRGSFNWQRIAGVLAGARGIDPEDFQLLIDEHYTQTNVVVDWKRAAEEIGAEDESFLKEVKSTYYESGTPYVSLKLKGKKK